MNTISINSCRICLFKLGTTSLCDNRGDTTLMDMMKIFTNLNMLFDVNLPQYLCGNCELRLENAYLFRKEIEYSEGKLRELFPYVEPTKTEEVLESIEIKNEESAVVGIPVQVDIHVQDESVYKTEEEPGEGKENDEDGNSFAGHENDHELEISYVTEVTKSKFKKKTRLKSNTRHKILKEVRMKATKTTINTEENRTCKQCGKVFARYQNLVIHERIHTGEKPYECNLCDKKFTQKSNLFLHLKIHSQEKSFICEVCSKQFTTNLQLKQHMVTHLPESAKQFKCDTCPKAFHDKRTLKRHHAIHEGKKSFKCMHCQKGFITRCYLNKHIRTVHLSIKRHVCTVCGKAFSNSGNLRAHFRIHTGEKPYECKYCNAKFNQSTPLVRHTQQHIDRGDLIKIERY